MKQFLILLLMFMSVTAKGQRTQTLDADYVRIRDGLTVNKFEWGYIQGLTSNAQAQINLKAPLASPSFTGSPQSITPTAGDNSTAIATTAFVTNAVSGATISDATTTVKGKIKLAGDLSGTADLPTVPGLATKQNIITGGVSTAVTSNFPTNSALVSDSGGKITYSTTTDIEIGYVHGVTSSIQTQINTNSTNIASNTSAIAGKEPSIPGGTTLQYWRGDKAFVTLNTGAVPEGTNLYFTNPRAIAAPLTGYISGAGTITSTDSLLQAIQKLNGNVGALTTGVSSVFGRSGAVVATSGDYNTSQVTENTNLYFTNARSISAPLTGFVSGAGTITATDTVLQGIQKNAGNIAANTTAIAGKQNTITGAATSIVSSNLSTNQALASDASGKVTFSATTDTELGYLSGTTSSVQTQLNSKQATITGSATSITSANLATSKALVSDVSGKVAASSVTSTELSYVSGATSNLQSQITTNTNNISTNTSNIALKANIASPTFTGVPIVPTAAALTNNGQVASTQYVDSAVSLATVADATTISKGKIQLAGDLAGTAASPTVPGLATKAPLASPALTGSPTTPTATPLTNSTIIASTAYTDAAVTAATSSKVSGPASVSGSGDIAVFNGTTGKIIKDSAATINGTGDISANSFSAPTTSTTSSFSGLQLNNYTVTATGGNLTLAASGGNNITASNKVLFNSLLLHANTSDSATGSNATLTAPTTKYVRLTAAGTLVSIDGIPAGLGEQELILQNFTGASVTLNNDTGATTANRIYTGTGAGIKVPNNSAVELAYDQTAARWVVTGGSSLPSTLASTVTGATDLTVANVRISGDQIQTTDTNGNLLLAPNGTGSVVSNNNFQASSTFQETVTNNNSSGSFATIASHTSSVIRLINAGLASLGGIASPLNGENITLINKTGVKIKILNEDTSQTAANRIQTGQQRDMYMPINSSIQLKYDNTSARWQVEGVVPNSANSLLELQTDPSFEFGTGDGNCNSCTATVETTNVLVSPNNIQSVKLAFTASAGNYTVDKSTSSQYTGADFTAGVWINTTQSGVIFWSRVNSTNTDSKTVLNDGLWHYYEVLSTAGASFIGYQIQASTSITGNIYADESSLKVSSRGSTLANVTNVSSVQSYTPSFTGFGTVVSPECFWSRNGQKMKINCKFTSGTTTAVEARISLPSGYTIDPVSTPSLAQVGDWSRPTFSAEYGTVLAEPSATYLTIGKAGSGTGGLSKINASGAVASSEALSLNAEVTILGWTAVNPNLLTAPDTFSSDTSVLTFKASAVTSTDAVGTFGTYSVASSSNTRVACPTAPTQTTASMNTDGLFITPKAYNAASTCALPSVFQIQIGKNLKGVRTGVYKSTGKTTSGSLDYMIFSADTGAAGLSDNSYNESTGILTLDGGYNPLTSITSRLIFFEDASNQGSGYVTINASKNPALTGFNLQDVAYSPGASKINIVSGFVGVRSSSGCTTGTCSFDQVGTSVSGVTRSSTGTYVIAFNAGTWFSATSYYCTFTVDNTVVDGTYGGAWPVVFATPTTSTFTVRFKVPPNTAVDTGFYFNCFGRAP